MRYLITCAILALASTAYLCPSAMAQENFSIAQIGEILSSADYPILSNEDEIITTQIGDYSVVIFVSGEANDITYLHWNGDMPSYWTLEKIGRFNEEVKFGRIYLDDEGDPILQMDRNSEGGVTTENILSDLNIMRLLGSKLSADQATAKKPK